MKVKELYQTTNDLLKLLVNSGYAVLEARDVLIAAGELTKEVRDGKESTETSEERSSRL